MEEVIPSYSIKWTKPRLLGSLPCPRRGHSTNTNGPKLLLFGGQNTSTGQLDNDVCVLNIPDLRWRRLDVPGKAPCSRRGFKNQFFGTTVVISSGFVRSNRAARLSSSPLPNCDEAVSTFEKRTNLSNDGIQELVQAVAFFEPPARQERAHSWAYVKQHELQDPKDGRVIHPNQEMRDVFRVDQIGLTQVMGLISKHLEKKVWTSKPHVRCPTKDS
ncbi:unnamed protein product [Peronospora belbahrii]|uniref:DM2 domain-containing protein n=1 Tax=Peronospora belbahrii TaxID=622444 RepID=A0ABN8CV50_9STRA|nr:unnamed protein product [Peronospora belbahrii]